jgi:uncharacterized protein (UPF0335 family)
MTSTNQISTYAKQLAGILSEISELQTRAKDVVASAKDAGLNVSALRRVARELNLERDKREQIYEAENQLDMFRSAVGLRFAGNFAEAAE